MAGPSWATTNNEKLLFATHVDNINNSYSFINRTIIRPVLIGAVAVESTRNVEEGCVMQIRRGEYSPT